MVLQSICYNENMKLIAKRRTHYIKRSSNVTIICTKWSNNSCLIYSIKVLTTMMANCNILSYQFFYIKRISLDTNKCITTERAILSKWTVINCNLKIGILDIKLPIPTFGTITVYFILIYWKQGIFYVSLCTLSQIYSKFAFQ